MSNFKDQTWANRLGTMGDTAENAFLSVHPYAHRVGLNRPDFDVRGMLDPMRYAPDFMTSTFMYEVMGCTSRGDGKLKVKFEKLSALATWSCIGPVRIWVWDSGRKRYWDATLEDWTRACHTHGEVARFPDNNKPYFALPIANFPAEPIKHDLQP